MRLPTLYTSIAMLCVFQMGCMAISGQTCKSPQDVATLEKELRETNLEHQQDAFQHYPSNVPLTWFQPVRLPSRNSPNPYPATTVPPGTTAAAEPPEQGLLREAGESLVFVPDEKSLVFVYADCALDSGCGCTVPREYRFAKTNGGRVVILRSMPSLDKRVDVHQCGVCGIGCGVQEPPRPPEQVMLPVQDPALVTVIGVPVDWKVLNRHCDQEVPVP